MKILWITPLILPEASEALGWDVPVVGGWVQSQLKALCCRYGSKHSYLVLAHDSRKCNIQIRNVRYRTFGEGKVTYGNNVPARIERDVQSVIKTFRPDIIHIHGTEFYYGRMNPAVYCGVPVVVSLQGILHGLAPYLNGMIPPHELFWHQFNLRWFLYGASVYRDQRAWIETRLPQEALIFKMHSHFIGRTQWDKSWVKALNSSAKYYHVNETLRDSFYGNSYRQKGVRRPHSIYCSAASGCPLKGVHVLFRAISLLKSKYPDIMVRICASDRLAQGNSLVSILKAEQYTSYLKSLVTDLELDKHIVCLPRLSDVEVVNELSMAELFVLPSFCENSPNSLGEAQLIGTPAIASYSGGIPSVLRDGVDGRLVPPGDHAILADMIDWFFTHTDEADAYAVAAKESAQLRHNPFINAEKTMEVYHEILNGHV